MDGELERFILAQDEDGIYGRALAEMREGRKLTEWPSCIFPVVQGPGERRPFAIDGLFGARRYMDDLTLRDRLCEITEAVLDHSDRDIREIFDGRGADVMMFRSSVTLFDAAAPDHVFSRAIRDFFDGSGDPWTLSCISKEKEFYNADSALRRYGVGGYDDRGFFESGICEAEEIPSGTRMPTMLDLVLKGEGMTGMVRHHLYWKDFSDYRLSSIASCLRHYCIELRHAMIDACSARGDKELSVRIARTFDGSVLMDCDESPLAAAEMFDRMVETFRSEQETRVLLEGIAMDSLLNREKYPLPKGNRGRGVYC